MTNSTGIWRKTICQTSNVIGEQFSVMRPSLLGNRGTRAFISGEQGNKDLNMRGTGNQTQFWGT